MAKRYIGDAVITIAYNDAGDYRGTVSAGGHTWRFADLHPPKMGFNFSYDSPEAYDKMAKGAASFGSYYSSSNRGDDTPDWAPDPETADAIDEAVSWAQDDRGEYEVRRSAKGATREGAVAEEAPAHDDGEDESGDERDMRKIAIYDDEALKLMQGLGWDLLNRDIGRLEQNSLAWMRASFNNVRDDGHSNDDLIGSFWFDPTDPNQAYLVELASEHGRNERIDMTDAEASGRLAHMAFNEVSPFGGSVLGGAINFFDVKPEDMETIEQTLEPKKARRPTPRHR